VSNLVPLARPSPSYDLILDSVGQLVVFASHAKQLIAKSSDGQILDDRAEPGGLLSVMR
jgi:hypothetical protein